MVSSKAINSSAVIPPFWVRAGGGAVRVLRGAAVTAERYPIGTVVCVQDPAMKQAGLLAASHTDASAKRALYGDAYQG
jgi:hypothetical protein